MAGLMLNPQIVNQDWGNAVLNLARDLAACNGINAILNDADRMPGGGSTALQSLGFSSSDAGLIVSTFGDLAALYRVGHGQQAQAVANDFFFHAKLLMGTVPMP